MEEFQRFRQEAERAIFVADHMLTVTYPLVKDTKLLLSVLMNIYKAMTLSVASILSYEYLFKRIPAFPKGVSEQLELFQARNTRRYNLDPEHLQFLRKIHELVQDHRSSPVEFHRKDKFVICSDNYRMSTISVDQLKQYLQKAKLFIGQMQQMVSKNERIFR